jgi:EAL domain-containing protein (putative c-di-GMP-specific phosphodiesterase class I)
MTAVEALIRWDHPEFGIISPAEFIPLAERNGLISDIGDWTLERACIDAAKLPPGIKVSVNLSRVQVSDRGFVKRTAQILERSGIDPGLIELEVTETAILDNEANAYRVLEELGALGVSVAIDDFGVGQSTLSSLRDLPVGRIKIDKSFVNDLETDTRARSIFVAIASLAKSLGILTTAEGIETEQQRTIAALAGCDHLQGYLMGRPQALADFAIGPDSGARLDVAS